MLREEQEKKAFDFAGDTIKQLIALTSAIVALTITFAKDIFVAVPVSAKFILLLAWIMYIVSLLFGVIALLVLTGTISSFDSDIIGSPPLSPPSVAPDENGLWNASIKRAAGGQIISFFIATFIVLIAGGAFAYGEFAKYSDARDAKAIRPILVDALFNRKTNELNTLLAVDGSFTSPGGAVITEPEMATAVTSGKLVFDEIHAEPFKTEVEGDTATETGFARARGKSDGRAFGGNFRYTLVLARRNGCWRALTLQLNPMP